MGHSSCFCALGRSHVICSVTEVVTASRLARDYNAGLEAAQDAVALHNEEMTSELVKIRATKATIQRCLLPMPEECPVLNHRWCRRFLQLMRWKNQPVNTAGSYLEWADPRLVSSRKKLHEHLASGVHKFLILNCDQVWRQNLRPGKNVMMKKHHSCLARCVTSHWHIFGKTTATMDKYQCLD